MHTPKTLVTSIVMTTMLLGFGIGSAIASTNVGFVNTITLMKKSPQGKAALQALKTAFAPRKKKLDAMQDAIKHLEHTFQRDKTVMSSAERKKLGAKIGVKLQRLRQAQAKFQHDLDARRGAELDKLRKEMFIAVRDVAKRDGDGLVVTQGVVYADARTNITKQVLIQMKKENHAGTTRRLSK